MDIINIEIVGIIAINIGIIIIIINMMMVGMDIIVVIEIIINLEGIIQGIYPLKVHY